MRETFIVERPKWAALRALNYTPEVERLRSRSGSGATSLGSLLEAMGPAYGSVFVRIDCDREHGVELITQTDMFAAEPEGRVIRRDSMPRPERHVVKRWQVLIAGAGTLGETELYGRAIIADSRLEGRYVGPHAMVLTFREPGSDQSLFTYAFLLTRVGLRAIRATSFGTKILGLRKDLLRDLPVPLPAPNVRSRVATLVRRCVAHRETYLTELKAARSSVEQLSEMREAHTMCAKRRSRAVMWSGPLPTISAWNYASPGAALKHLKDRWRTRLGDVLAKDGVFYGGRSSRIPCRPPYGVEFITQRDAFLVRPISRRVALPGLASTAIFAPIGSLLMAARGTLAEGELFGRPIVVSKALGRFGLTGDLLRLDVQSQHVPAAYAYLSTLVGRRLARSTAVGTKILQIRFDLLGELPFPDLSDKLRAAIKAHLSLAVSAKEQAEEAEDEAVRIVEEEVLPEWLA